jgi:hypothetical protein
MKDLSEVFIVRLRRLSFALFSQSVLSLRSL